MVFEDVVFDNNSFVTLLYILFCSVTSMSNLLLSNTTSSNTTSLNSRRLRDAATPRAENLDVEGGGSPLRETGGAPRNPAPRKHFACDVSSARKLRICINVETTGGVKTWME